MKKVLKNKFGITLIALIITIIVMLILAGITISLTLGQNGIINLAQKAGQNHIDAENKEKEDLEELYSSMMVATNDDSKITISMEDLNNLINQKIEGLKPTGIKTDTYIKNSMEVTSAYDEVTSMSGNFTKQVDTQNKMSEYLSYSDEDGYTVLKSGWYNVEMVASVVASSSNSTDTSTYFYLNNEKLYSLYSWAKGSGYADANRDIFSIFLSEGDKIYFSSRASGTAQTRKTIVTVYPMF